jgi:type IV pilus assembly protein PilV
MRLTGHESRKIQSGFSLIEVLVSTVVFSIGVLGVTGLAAVSKRASFDSVQRSTAAELAYTLLEEIRSNSLALDVYLAAGTLGRGSRGAAPAPACDSVAAACTPAEFAADSLWSWEQMLDTGMEQAGGVGTGGLVDPSACITGPGGAGMYVVTIAWRGATELTDSGLNDCGAASGLYGAGNANRRLVVVQSYIDPDF